MIHPNYQWLPFVIFKNMTKGSHWIYPLLETNSSIIERLTTNWLLLIIILFSVHWIRRVFFSTLMFSYVCANSYPFACLLVLPTNVFALGDIFGIISPLVGERGDLVAGICLWSGKQNNLKHSLLLVSNNGHRNNQSKAYSL